MLTDVKEVLPLLQRNYENNISAAALRGERSAKHTRAARKKPAQHPGQQAVAAGRSHWSRSRIVLFAANCAAVLSAMP